MKDKIKGCIFGLALGDALGAETEFWSYDYILRQYPPRGIMKPEGNPARVTDDTQMAIAVAKSLLAAPQPYHPNTLTPLLIEEFEHWYHDPENNRAPGVTCLESIEKLMTGQHWQNATNISSKGCGANMRVQPVGLLPVDATTRARIAQLQAVITHGHPTGLAAADLTAWVIADLLNGGDVDTLLSRVRAYAESQRRVYYADWLDELYMRAMVFPSGEDFIAHGWQENINMLDKVEVGLQKRNFDANPCDVVGASWIAEEAFATALYCFLLYPDDPAEAMRRAANSSGDSDSIACIAGAFAGVYCGFDQLPQEWISRIEYHDELEHIADGFAKLHR